MPSRECRVLVKIVFCSLDFFIVVYHLDSESIILHRRKSIQSSARNLARFRVKIVGNLIWGDAPRYQKPRMWIRCYSVGSAGSEFTEERSLRSFSASSHSNLGPDSGKAFPGSRQIFEFTSSRSILGSS